MSVKEYEDLIDEQDLELDNNKKKRDIPQDDSGDFEDIIDESDSEKELMLANSLKRAVKQNPDRRAEVLRLSNQSSLPPDFVERNFDLVKTKIAESSVETTKLTKRAPKTTDWLKEYDNAIVAKDDIESLKKIEDATSSLSFFDKVKKTASDVTDYFLAEEANDINLTKSLKIGFAQAGKSLSQVPEFVRDVYYSNIVEEKKRLEESIKRYEQAGVSKKLYEFDKDRLDRLNEKLASGQVRPSTKEEFNNPLAVYFDKHTSANQFPELNREILKELIDNGNYAKAGETAFYKAMANLPNSAIILGSALAKVPGVGLGYAGVTTAAGEQAKAVGEVGDKVSREDITQASITKGAIEVGFEGIGLFGFMQPWANALSKEFGKQTAKEVLKNVGKTAAYSFGENANEEAWTSAFQNLTDVGYGIQPLDMNKILGEAVESFLVGGISGATMTTPGVFALAGQRIQDVQKAQEAKKTFEAIGDATKDSKLKARLPEKLREYVDSVTKDGPVSDVYISTEALETFFQSKNESVTKMVQDMGILAEYNAAKEAGLDVKIPLSQAVEKLVDNGYYKELSDDVKFSPEAKTVNEIKKEKLEQEALIKEGLKEITEETFSYEDSAKEIGSQITKQLMDTGMKQKDAKVQGLIYETVFLNYGRRLKVDPKELFDKFALSIGKGEAPVEGALFQPGDYKKIKVDVDHDYGRFEAKTKHGMITGEILGQSYEDMLSADGEPIKTKKLQKLSEKFSNVWRIDTIEINENVQGKGYGAQLLDSAIVAAKQNNADAIILNASPMGEDNTLDDLIGFYSSRGFSVVDKYKNQNATMLLNMSKAPKTLFQGSPTDPRGQIRFGKDAINIDLLKNADMSTFLHETGHFFFKVMQDISAKDEAPQDIKDDFNVVKEFLGEVGDKFTVEQQEKFARGFEAYLMEGKAPRKQLKKAFERFKVWLIDVYKSLTNLNVELTPEIRAVFDRMFAAETETSIIENEVNKDLMLSDPHGVLSEADANKYLELKELANKDAKEKLTAKLMKDVVIAQKKEYKAKFDELKSKALDQAKELTVFKAIAAIQGDMKLDSNVIKKDFAQFKDSLPTKSTTTKDGAAHPDVVAQVFGYENGQAMLEDIAPYRKGIEDYAENIALGEMKKLYPELLTSPELSNEAIEAYHNDNLRKLKTLELEFLTKESPRIPKEIAARLIRRMPRQAEVKEQATQMIAQSKVSELSPHRYRLAERRAANDAAKAYKRGDFEAAFEAKRKELLAFELYVQAFEAKADVDKSIKSFKKILKSDEEISKNRDVNYVNVAQAILSEFGITRGEKTSAEYLEAMSKYDPEGYANVSQLFTEAVKDADNYKNVSYDKFVSMKESVSAIFDLAKSVKEIEIDGKAMDKEVILGEMTSQIQKVTPESKKQYEMTKSKMDNFKTDLIQFKAKMTRIEAWSEAMDIEGRGPFKRYLFQPISDAVTKYRLEKNDVLKKYLDIVKKNQKIFTNDTIVADELNYYDNNGNLVRPAFRNKSELLMALLHTGNKSNLQKLLVGRNWGEVLDDKTLNTSKWDAFISRMHKEGVLTKADYDFAQSVWDLNESLKPNAQKAHKKMYGYYFSEITAEELVTPFGTYKGGYIPAKADIYSVEDAAIRQEREEFEKNNSSFMFPTTGRGFTESRSEGYNVPLSLDMNLLGSHIDGVLRFTHIEPRVKELSRIMTDKGFRAELAKFDPEIAKVAIIPWLQRAATQQVITAEKTGIRIIDKTSRLLRKNVAIQIMFSNVVNTLQQTTGLIVAMSKVKPKHIRNGFFTYLTKRSELIDSINSKSEWMRSVQGNNIFELQQHINEILVNPSTFESMRDFTAKHTYFMQSAAQNFVNTIVWQGAYDQNIAEGKSEIEAVRNADAAVRTTQGTTNAEDISGIETGSPIEMLFKQFMSYFNMLANLNSSELLKIQRSIGLRKGAGKAFFLYLAAFAIPAFVSEVIAKGMSGQPWDEDNDDNYIDDTLAVFFGSQVKTGLALFPYVGQVSVSAYNRFNDKIYDDRLSLSPAINVMESTLGLGASVYKDITDKGEISKKTVKDSLQLVGIMTGLPIGTVGKPIGYLMDVESGKVEEPTGPVDLVRGLVTGKGNRQ